MNLIYFQWQGELGTNAFICLHTDKPINIRQESAPGLPKSELGRRSDMENPKYVCVCVCVCVWMHLIMFVYLQHELRQGALIKSSLIHPEFKNRSVMKCSRVREKGILLTRRSLFMFNHWCFPVKHRHTFDSVWKKSKQNWELAKGDIRGNF